MTLSESEIVTFGPPDGSNDPVFAAGEYSNIYFNISYNFFIPEEWGQGTSVRLEDLQMRLVDLSNLSLKQGAYAPPRIEEMAPSFVDGGNDVVQFDTLVIRFSESVSMQPGDVVMTEVGGDGSNLLALADFACNSETFTASYRLPAEIVSGTYHVNVSSAIIDLDDNFGLDGDGDGFPGPDASGTFTVIYNEPPVFLPTPGGNEQSTEELENFTVTFQATDAESPSESLRYFFNDGYQSGMSLNGDCQGSCPKFQAGVLSIFPRFRVLTGLIVAAVTGDQLRVDLRIHRFGFWARAR